MGRQLRRVPLDFDWPLRRVWQGFLNPHWRDCPRVAVNDCFGGYTAAGKWLNSIAHFLALIGEQAAQNTPEHAERRKRTGEIYPHPYLESWAQAPRLDLPSEIRHAIHAMEPGPARTAATRAALEGFGERLLPMTSELAALIHGLSGGREYMFGADYEIHKALKRAAGMSEKWGECRVCAGDGMDPAIKEVYESWKQEPPPQGPGWQLWETVSEGSPISRVYPTREAFVDYLVGEGYSRSAAESFCEKGWVFSAMMTDGKVHKDIHALDRDEKTG